jgi:hypothetical protein
LRVTGGDRQAVSRAGMRVPGKLADQIGLMSA